MGEGYWVWLIRLASGATSVGIVASEEHHDFNGFNRLDKALAWLRQREPQCAAVVEQHRDRILDFRVMRNYSYSCDQVFSGTERWAITGEAGIFLDPLYSPGLDQVAISNSLACDLIRKSLSGADVSGTAAAYNKLYLTIADIWLGIYKGQYGLLGNATVMTAKVIWDTAFYWAVFGFLFFHGKFLNVGTNQSMINDLEGLTALSNRVQQFFREWEPIEPEGLRGLRRSLHAAQLHGRTAPCDGRGVRRHPQTADREPCSPGTTRWADVRNDHQRARRRQLRPGHCHSPELAERPHGCRAEANLPGQANRLAHIDRLDHSIAQHTREGRPP